MSSSSSSTTPSPSHSPSAAAAPLLHALRLCSSLLDSHNPTITTTTNPHDAVLLTQEAHHLHQQLQAWLNPSRTHPPTTTQTTTATAASPAFLDALPTSVWVLILHHLSPKRPTMTKTYTDLWKNLHAFSLTSKKCHMLSQDDALWRPLCLKICAALVDPNLRRIWRAEGWAALYRRLAQTSRCIEVGGYRSRWMDDYVLQFDLRDVRKGIMLFSQGGIMEVRTSDEWKGGGRDFSIVLSSPFIEIYNQLQGEARWVEKGLLTPHVQVHKGIRASELLNNSRAMESSDVNRNDPWECYQRYLEYGTLLRDVRLEVRLLHVPTGKTTTLYNSQEVFSYPLDTFYNASHTNKLVSFDLNRDGGESYASFRSMTLASGTALKYAQPECGLLLREEKGGESEEGEKVGKGGGGGGGGESRDDDEMDLLRDEAYDSSDEEMEFEHNIPVRQQQRRREREQRQRQQRAAKKHNGPFKEEWAKDVRLGIFHFSLSLKPSEEQMATKYAQLATADPMRLAFTTLQSLPWI